MHLFGIVGNRIKIAVKKNRLSKINVKAKKAKIDSESIFEGNNKLEPNVKFYKSKIGRYSYIARDSVIVSTDIGRFSCIGPRVMVVFGEHPLNFVSMHPAFYSTKNQVGNSFTEADRFEEYRYVDKEHRYAVRIGNDVWIGADCRIIEGVTIGDGAAVLAGAVVAENVPPYSVVGGVPAKVIKYRFNEEQRVMLEKNKWWDKDLNWIQRNAIYFADINNFCKEACKEE